MSTAHWKSRITLEIQQPRTTNTLSEYISLRIAFGTCTLGIAYSSEQYLLIHNNGGAPQLVPITFSSTLYDEPKNNRMIELKVLLPHVTVCADHWV